MGRAELGAVLSCAATNNNVTAPVSRRVSLDIVFPPAEVAITSVGQPLVAGVTYLVACEAAGSRPDPVISWWLASQIMAEDAQQLVEVVGEVTRYTLHSPVYIISTQYLLNIYFPLSAGPPSTSPPTRGTTARSWRAGRRTPTFQTRASTTPGPSPSTVSQIFLMCQTKYFY